MTGLHALKDTLEKKQFQEIDRENDRKIMLNKITKLSEISNNMFRASTIRTSNFLEGGKKQRNSRRTSRQNKK
ncbi:hypothetical protein BMW23_0730 [Bodo saltans virus]|uniref:Uncharacterized protein n=1 Tax=Bodo saltans virus TaxID=2024608 RepID=A0A2H4UV94_9VIRU|nr:hypothetical protein QJ851_gp0713 [Bodo saltans virus]ATZ80776.1 hypothetical protein BMW23_0730 [Bodo saltans virus]